MRRVRPALRPLELPASSAQPVIDIATLLGFLRDLVQSRLPFIRMFTWFPEAHAFWLCFEQAHLRLSMATTARSALPVGHAAACLSRVPCTQRVSYFRSGHCFQAALRAPLAPHSAIAALLGPSRKRHPSHEALALATAELLTRDFFVLCRVLNRVQQGRPEELLRVPDRLFRGERGRRPLRAVP
jgi:hypothetical protein